MKAPMSKPAKSPLWTWIFGITRFECSPAPASAKRRRMLDLRLGHLDRRRRNRGCRGRLRVSRPCTRRRRPGRAAEVAKLSCESEPTLGKSAAYAGQGRGDGDRREQGRHRRASGIRADRAARASGRPSSPGRARRGRPPRECGARPRAASRGRRACRNPCPRACSPCPRCRCCRWRRARTGIRRAPTREPSNERTPASMPATTLASPMPRVLWKCSV